MNRIVLFLSITLLAAHAWGETWPPLRPPSPMAVEWVVQEALKRHPDVHAKHRAWLAALARVPAQNPDKEDLRAQILAHDADLVRLNAIEHHLEIEAQARIAFYDYALASESILLIQEQKRLWEQYQIAMRARMNKSGTPTRDLALESARLHTQLIKLLQERDAAAARMTALIDHSRTAPPYPPPKWGELTPLPPDRDALLGKALSQSERMRRAQTEIKRAEATMLLARTQPTPGLTGELAAATHELARRQEAIRAVALDTLRAVTTQHDLARNMQSVIHIYQQEIMPRLDQGLLAALAAYQAGDDITRVLDAHANQIDAQRELFQARVDFEKALIELTRTLGVLSPALEKRMSRIPLNVGGQQ